MIRVGAPVLAEAHLGGGQPYIAGKFTGDGFHRHTHFGSSQALPFAPAINSAPRILARPAGRNVIHDRWNDQFAAALWEYGKGGLQDQVVARSEERRVGKA